MLVRPASLPNICCRVAGLACYMPDFQRYSAQTVHKVLLSMGLSLTSCVRACRHGSQPLLARSSAHGNSKILVDSACISVHLSSICAMARSLTPSNSAPCKLVCQAGSKSPNNSPTIDPGTITKVRSGSAKAAVRHVRGSIRERETAPHCNNAVKAAPAGRSGSCREPAQRRWWCHRLLHRWCAPQPASTAHRWYAGHIVVMLCKLSCCAQRACQCLRAL